MVKKFVVLFLIVIAIIHSAIPQYYCFAADDKHYKLLENAIGSIHKTNFKNLVEIAVFDLGFTKSQLEKLSQISKLKIYEVERVNEFITAPILTSPGGRRARGAFSWKPVIIKQCLEMYPYVLYLDAQISILDSLDPIFQTIVDRGYFFLDCAPHNLVDRITNPVIQKVVNKDFPRRAAYIMDPTTYMITAGVQGVSPKILESYILPQYEYAKDISLFIDDGSAKMGFGAGRHDQTIAAILVRLLGFKTSAPDGYSELVCSGKTKKIHIHWNRRKINKDSCMLISKRGVNYNFSKYIKYQVLDSN